MGKYPVDEIADAIGGTITETGRLPDGSGFAVMSTPLPKTHWIYESDKDGFTGPPPMPFRMGGNDPRRRQWSEMVRAAGRYAVKAATRRGKDMDFDPDALLQNLVVGMFGYHTNDGLDDEAWGNPIPIPPLYNDTDMALSFGQAMLLIDKLTDEHSKGFDKAEARTFLEAHQFRRHQRR